MKQRMSGWRACRRKMPKEITMLPLQLILIIIIAAFANTTPPAFAVPRQYDFCVQAFKDISISDADVDDILARATAILAATKPSQCDAVKLTRNANTISYDETQLPSTLGSKNAFNKLIGAQCVKVVQRITWCGGPFLAGYGLGCSPIPGKVMIVVRAYPGYRDSFNHGVEPVTWLHEFGHNLGLLHNYTNQSDVMYPGILPTSTTISAEECATYAGLGSKNPGAAAPGASVPLIQPAQAGDEKSDVSDRAGSPSLTAFVRQPFTKNSIDQARSFQNQTKQVEQLLSNRDFEPYKPNIIAMLGVIGTSDTVPMLTNFLQTTIVGPPDGPEVLSRFTALTAIGTIANRLKLPETSFAVLKAGIDPNFWWKHVQLSDSKTNKMSESDAQTLVEDLSAHAIQSYALTGSEAAAAYLKEQKDNINKTFMAVERDKRATAIDEAIQLNAESRSKGALEVLQ
jgi:hypothetical protein